MKESLRKHKIKCFVLQSWPCFIVSDGHFSIPAYFTKEAVKEFKQEHPQTNISDLKDCIIVINTWTLEAINVNSREIWTSYANLEVRLVVKSMKSNLQTKQRLAKFPQNIFRDDLIKSHVSAFIMTNQNIQLEKEAKKQSLPTMESLSKKQVSSQIKTEVKLFIIYLLRFLINAQQHHIV